MRHKLFYSIAGLIVEGKQKKDCWKFINTGLIDRYSSNWSVEPLTHKGRYYFEPCLDISNPIISKMREVLYKKPKIIVAKMALRIEAFIDANGDYSSANTNCIYGSEYSLFYLGAVLNSKLMRIIYDEYFGALIMSGGYFQYQAPQLKTLPIRPISFSTPEKERKERVSAAIELYKKYMVKLERGHGYENKEDSARQRRPLADGTIISGKEEAVHGEHSGTGERVHGVRGRARKHEDAQRVSEESEEYSSTTRYVESSLGIKSYTELAPYLAQGVERVMASLLDRETAAIKITPEFICGLHKDAFRELFPSWAGCYRDRDVTVGKHKPPPYFEVPILMRQYCEDLEVRLASVGENPAVSDVLLETLAFAEGRFLSIHPFLDFNGRVARMLLFALLYRLDLPPVPLIPDAHDEAGRKDYFDVLSAGDQFDWQPLVEVWKRRLGTGGKA
jgi:fido (protein-threonine AMPylation protein)